MPRVDRGSFFSNPTPTKIFRPKIFIITQPNPTYHLHALYIYLLTCIIVSVHYQKFLRISSKHFYATVLCSRWMHIVMSFKWNFGQSFRYVYNFFLFSDNALKFSYDNAEFKDLSGAVLWTPPKEARKNVEAEGAGRRSCLLFVTSLAMPLGGLGPLLNIWNIHY